MCAACAKAPTRGGCFHCVCTLGAHARNPCRMARGPDGKARRAKLCRQCFDSHAAAPAPPVSAPSPVPVSPAAAALPVSADIVDKLDHLCRTNEELLSLVRSLAQMFSQPVMYAPPYYSYPQ